jgi:hypothetical protein
MGHLPRDSGKKGVYTGEKSGYSVMVSIPLFPPGNKTFFLEVGDARGLCWAANLGSKELVAGRGGDEEGCGANPF